MKIFIGLLAAFLLVVLGTTVDAQAQTYYLGNSSPAAVTSATLQTSCGAIGPFFIPPNTIIPIPLPPGCTATGVWYQSIFYPVGFFGPIPPPNPPNSLIVTPGRAVFLP